MKKIRPIVLGSVLKPVNEPRMYFKIAKSIRQQFPEIPLHVVGFKSSAEVCDDRIFLHPIFDFKRLSFKRLFCNVRFLFLLIKLKPRLIIVHTFELLPAAVLYKFLLRSILIYDVQENYVCNVLHGKVFPRLIKKLIAFPIRLIEYVSGFYTDHFLLAESCYSEELKFIKKRYTILENKLSETIIPERRKASAMYKKFVVSGTLSEYYGIFDAIDLIQKMHEIDDEYTLEIIGFCAQKAIYEKLCNKIANKPYIQLVGGEQPVPYATIVEHIRKADAALLPYQLNPCFKQKIPTKFYEYMALRKPMIISNNSFWKTFFSQFSFRSAVWIDFKDFNAQELVCQLKDRDFYGTDNFPSSFYWSYEALKLKQVLSKFIIKE